MLSSQFTVRPQCRQNTAPLCDAPPYQAGFGGKESHTGQRHVGKHELNMGQWSKRGVRLSGCVTERRQRERERGKEPVEREREKKSERNRPVRATTPLPENNRSHIHLLTRWP